MVSNKVLLILLLSFLRSRTEAILLDFGRSEPTVPDIHIKLEEVLKSCFDSRLSTLVITSDLDAVVRGILDDSVVANVFLLDEKFNALQSHQNFPRWPMFLLTVNSTTALTRILQQLKSSAFWHADSTFFFVGIPKGGCNRASKMLWKSWEMNLLESFYICEDLESGIMLHTYNPFTNRAPAPWKRVETRSDGRWTLYSRSFLNGKSICESLEFDKTKFLDGYKVNIATTLRPGVTLKNNETVTVKNLAKKIIYYHAMSQPIVWARMNITPVIQVATLTKNVENILSSEFDRKTYDYAVILFSINHMTGKETFSFMYPVSMFSVSILTKHRHFLTPAEKISNFYSLGAVSLTGLVFFITWTIFVIQNQGKVTSALEILRMVVGTSMLQRFRGNPMRIYLFGVFWLVIIVNATFQGNMAMFLTKPTRNDVETVKDLQTHKLRIHVPKFYHSYVLFKVLQNIPKSDLHLMETNRCDLDIVNDINAACIQPLLTILHSATEYDLSISEKPITKLYPVFPYRADWPLAKKVDVYMMRLMAAGLLDHWQAASESRPLEKLKARDDQATAPVIRKIKLVDLNFAFVILGIGLTIAALFFVVEVGGNPTKKRPSKWTKRPQQSRRRIKRSNNAVHASVNKK